MNYELVFELYLGSFACSFFLADQVSLCQFSVTLGTSVSFVINFSSQ